MQQASTAPPAPPAPTPAAAPPSPETVDPRRLSLNPPAPSPRTQEPAQGPPEQPAPTASASASPEPDPRPDRSPLFRPSSALANHTPAGSTSTSAAPSPARPQAGPTAAAGRKFEPADDDVDELADDEADDDLKQPVASTSKAAAPSSSSLPPPVKRYAGNLTPSSQPKKRHRISTLGTPDRSGTYRPPPLPHYTVVRSAHNSSSSPHLIRIHDNVTDGSKARWPDDSECDLKHKVAGRENWYECPPPDQGRHKMFRDKLGEEMAKKLGLSDDDPNAHWAVENLPKGHLFTVHHCVTSSNHPRQDVYIFGSAATHKFRTVNEFVPHLYWLLSHGPGDGLRCECKYCTKKSQSDVNRIVGLTDGRSSSVVSDRSTTPRMTTARASSGPAPRSSGGAGHGGGAPSTPAVKATIAKAGDPGTETLLPPLKKKKRKRESGSRAGSPSGSSALAPKKVRNGVDAAANGAAPAPAVVVPAYRGSFTMRQRDEDLRDVGLPRQAEVVWVKLARPLLPREEGGTAITHWPAVVRAREFVSEAKVVRAASMSDEDDEDDEMVIVEPSKKGEGKERAKVEAQDVVVELAAASNLAPKPPVALSTTQRPVFNLALLGLADELRRVALADTLPWLGHTPPSDLMRPERITDPDSAKHVWDGTKTTRDAKLADFECAEDAATAVALACQVVAHVVASFSPGEKYAITPAAIAYPPGTSADEVAAVEQQVVKTWAFQCVYFGAELLWPGDVVRLLNTDLVDLLGPEGAVEPGEDRGFFLRVAIVYKAPDADSLKVGGEVWTLDEDEGAGSRKLNGVNGSAPAKERSPAPSTSSNGSSTSPKVTGAAARPRQPADLPPHMPPAPAGRSWRLLTAPGAQAHFDLDFLGGRVHPLPAAINSRGRIRDVRASFAGLGRRLGGPGLLDEDDEAAGERELEEDDEVEADPGELALTFNDEQRALVLAGLKTGVRLYTQVGTWRPSRQIAILKAEEQASLEVSDFFKARGLTPTSSESTSREGSAAA
ncbi:hypothetical protein JCM9279_003606 [Rhodotorula babjevae]